MRLIAELNYNPGFLLLLDYFQGQLDTLTDELGEAGENGEDIAKLRYWQAFRKILRTLQSTPRDFELQLTPEDRRRAEFMDVTHLRQRVIR
jgi:hypothetical protein